MTNYYKVLGIEDNSVSAEIIEEKYLLIKKMILSKIDLGEENSLELIKKLEQIEIAHETLSNPTKKKNYDIANKLIRENSNLINRDNQHYLKIIEESKKKNEKKETSNKELEDPIKQKNYYLINKLKIENNGLFKKLNSENTRNISDSKKFNNEEKVVNEKSSSQENGKRSIFWVIVFLVIGILIFLAFFEANKENLYQPTTATITQVTRKTPTISIVEDKSNLLRTANSFAEYLEQGSANAIILLDTDGDYYKENIEAIKVISHDTLKFGEYIRIYDLSISSYSDYMGTVSGYFENRSFYGWTKYYIDIYLSKVNNTWYIYGWNTKKT